MRTLYTKECKHCHRKFKTFDNSMEFCNSACEFDYQQPTKEDIETGKEIINELKLPSKLCLICNWEFIPKHKNQLCCCNECSMIHQRNLARKNYHYKYKEIKGDYEND